MTQEIQLEEFGLNAPTDGAGIELPSFSLYQTYYVDRSKLQQVCQKLYDRVFTEVKKGSLGNAKARLLTYSKNNDKRTYIVVTRDTIYQTRTTIFIRFLSYGDNLYIGLDTYVIGKLNWVALILTILWKFLVFIIILIANKGVEPYVFNYLNWSEFIIKNIWDLFIYIIIFAGVFFPGIKLIKRIIYERNIGLALRQEFPGIIGLGPFDTDDIMMFAKSTLHTAVISVRHVFKEEGLPVESLDLFAENINNITISTGGGLLNMAGSIIGIKNKMK